MESLFLYQRWLHETVKAYVTSSKPSQLKGRIILMPPRQYAAALMQAYLGKASLSWISDISGVPLECLQDWRTEREFLLVMDWSKSIFSEAFQQKLVLNDYSVPQYHEISAEFAMLEESLRVSARIGLYRRFKTLGERLVSHSRHGIAMNTYDLNLFGRLFLFFLALEYHWPSPAGNLIRKEFLPFVKEVAWPRQGHEHWVEPELEAAQHKYPSSRIRLFLADQLKRTFRQVGPVVARA